MRKKDTAYRYWPFDDLQFLQAETWLNDLANQGWQFISIGIRFAKFRRCEPGSLRFGCVLNTFDSFSERDKAIELYRQAGWGYVYAHNNLLIFSAPAQLEFSQIQQDTCELLRALKRALRKHLIGFSIITVTFLLFLAYLLFAGLPYKENLLQGIQVMLLILLLFVPVFVKAPAVKNVAVSVALLSRGQPLKRQQPYKGLITLAKAQTLVTTAIFMEYFTWVLLFWR